MKSNEELEAELEELRKEFYFFSQNGLQNNSQGTSPSTGSQGSQGGSNNSGTSSSDDEGWTVLYDRYSDDPAINLGKPKGILGNDGYIDGMPDLLQFSKIRMTFHVYNSLQEYEFILPKNTDFNGMRILQHNGYGNIIVLVTTSYEVYEGKGLLYFGRIDSISFYQNKYPILDRLDNKESVRFEKITAK